MIARPAADLPVPLLSISDIATSAGALRKIRIQGHRQIPQRHGLHDHPSGTRQRGDEQTLSAEQRVLEPSDRGDIVSHGLLPRDGMRCGHLQHLPGGQVLDDEIAASADERDSVSGYPLEDQPPPAEHYGSKPLLEGQLHLHMLVGSEESGFLDEPCPSRSIYVHDLPRGGLGETHHPVPCGPVLDQEQGGPRDGPLYAGPRPLLGLRLQGHVACHVCHGSGNGIQELVGSDLDVEHLQVVAGDGAPHEERIGTT